MRLLHFERFRPICPVCVQAGRGHASLRLGTVIVGTDSDVVEGMLVCSTTECQREYPVIEGIPIIVADIRSYMTNQLSAVLSRCELSSTMQSLIGDCVGIDSEFNTNRYRLSTYARDHYCDYDSTAKRSAEHSSSVARLVRQACELIDPPAGIWLDVGCSVGRSSFEIAERTHDLVLGLDLNFAMLRLAMMVARHGRIEHPLRRLGLVYDRRSYEVVFNASERVDFWACDALALPFAAGTVDGACSLNVIDCTQSPLTHLAELGRVLRPNGTAVVCTPYDWSSATPEAGWLGGHSQRSESRGDCVAELRRVLSDRCPPGIDSHLRMEHEIEHVPWQVYVHERASMMYDVHVAVARAIASSPPVPPASLS